VRELEAEVAVELEAEVAVELEAEVAVELEAEREGGRVHAAGRPWLT